MRPLSVVDLYRYDFRSFVEFVFHELHPGASFVGNWHVDLLADRLMRCAPGGDRRLMINVPPRYLKSLCASIAWPLFLLARHPAMRICIFAGTPGLAAAFSEARWKILRSKRFRTIFPGLGYREVGDALRFDNGGELVQTVVHRSQIGRGADLIIIDDPLSPAHACDDQRRAAVNSWYEGDVIPRLNHKWSAAVVVVMQRLHVSDLCGHLLRGEEHWEQVTLPAVAATDEVWTLADGSVRRRARGAALCPILEDRASLLERLEQIKGRNFYAQYLQAPITTAADNDMRYHFQDCMVYDGWEPGMPSIPPQMGRMNVAVDIRRTYFGEQDPDWRPGLRPMTDDEWEQDVLIQQNQLLSEYNITRS